MRLEVNVDLHTLHCVTPTDPSGEDEPYLWVFFIRADGETIRQSTFSPLRLSANLQVVSGPGRPGNLSTGGMRAGSQISIPANVGHQTTDLRPIILSFTHQGNDFRAFIPGVTFAMAVLMDEEGVPRDAMQTAHGDVRNLVEERLNDFFNSLNLEPFVQQAIDEGIDAANRSLMAQINEFVGDRNRGLVREATNVAIQSAVISVLSSNNPIDHIASGLDKDEFIGATRMQVSELLLVEQNLIEVFAHNLSQNAPDTGGGVAWYVLQGSASGELKFTQADAVIVSPASDEEGMLYETGEYVFPEDRLCISEGTSVEWSKYHHEQQYDVSVAYPFVQFQYKLDGTPLEGVSDTVQIGKEVSIPEFDPSTYEFVRYRQETRNVKVSFSRVRPHTDRQIEHLRLSNDPADGSYLLHLDIEAVLNDGRRFFAGHHIIAFDGQTITLPQHFVQGVKKCLEPLTTNRFSKSVRVGPKDLWGRMVRYERYKQIEQTVEAAAAAGRYDPSVVEAVKDAVAAKLKVQR